MGGTGQRRGCVLGLDYGSRRIGLAVSDEAACSHFRPEPSNEPASSAIWRRWAR